MKPHPRPLGRIRDAGTDRAIELFPFEVARAAVDVEMVLRLPSWLDTHDQGTEGSCVGHAVALSQAIVNTAEMRAHGSPNGYRRYDPIAVWQAAKAIDEYPGTHPGDNNGTSVRAAYEVARTAGLRRVRGMVTVNGKPTPKGERAWDPAEGVNEYRWARTIDEIRTAIAIFEPVAIGVDWYTGFDDPLVKGNRERWLPSTTAISGRIRGGHSVALVGASDRRQAFRLVNSWGRDYPPVWIPYPLMAELLAHRGEAALVTDRPSPTTAEVTP